MEDWVTIRNLHKRGKSIKDIVRTLGVSRNTVRKALRSEQLPRYRRKEEISQGLAPFADYIRQQILVKHLKGSRVLEDIRSKGFTGSKSGFYRYLKKIVNRAPPSYQPYETAPGEQAQFDWSPYTVVIGDVLTKIFVYGYLLGYSRYRVYWVSLSEVQGSVFEALEAGINQSGGVTQRVQTDNAKCFVINASRHHLQWNKHYLGLCGHYGFEPSRSLPGHPWSKGKVENPFDYLEDHFIKENRFDSFEHLVEKLKAFQIQVNERVHDTTRARPIDLLEKEKLALVSLPASPYVGTQETLRKVTADCLISFQGSKYSVPHFFVGKQVWVRVSKGYYIDIYASSGKHLARHEMSLAKGKVIMIDAHYKNHQVERGNWTRLLSSFTLRFPLHLYFAEKLKIQKRINPNYHLTQILELANYYSTEVMQAAFEQAHQYNFYSYHIIQAIVDSQAPLPPTMPVCEHAQHHSQIPNQAIGRDLTQYNQYLNQYK